MQINTLQPKTKRKTSAKVGRGGKRGKTSGRGTKGQNARAGRKKRPELRDLIKKLPKLRGRGVHSLKQYREKPIALNLSKLDAIFNDGEIVSAESVSRKLSLKKIHSVKILSTGDVKKKLVLKGVQISKEAKKKIEAAGGKFE